MQIDRHRGTPLARHDPVHQLIGPTRHVQDVSSLAVIFAGTGMTPSSRAKPNAPSRTSGEPSPHAPRTCGAHADHASGRASSAHAAPGEAFESAVKVRMSWVRC